MPENRPRNYIERLPEILSRDEVDVSHRDPGEIEGLSYGRAGSIAPAFGGLRRRRGPEAPRPLLPRRRFSELRDPGEGGKGPLRAGALASLFLVLQERRGVESASRGARGDQFIMGFQEDMAKLQRTFRLLEREYEQWFSGALPKPPTETQRVCEEIVRQYNISPPRNLSEQSLFSMLQARYNTYTEMWNRRTRLKEEGRVPGGRESPKRSGPKPPSPPSAPSDPFRQVFDSFVAAKQKAGEATTKLNS